MNIIETISEDAMLAVFLQAEYASSRWQGQICDYMTSYEIESNLITKADTSDIEANKIRRAIFDHYRSYTQREGLFDDFPRDIIWHRASISPDELKQIRYIDYSYWNEISGGTRLAVDAVKTIRADTKIYHVPNDGYGQIAEALKKGQRFPPMILLATVPNTPLVVLEGHMRLTGYMLVPEHIPLHLEVIIGFSEQVANWGLY